MANSLFGLQRKILLQLLQSCHFTVLCCAVFVFVFCKFLCKEQQTLNFDLRRRQFLLKHSLADFSRDLARISLAFLHILSIQLVSPVSVLFLCLKLKSKRIAHRIANPKVGFNNNETNVRVK